MSDPGQAEILGLLKNLTSEFGELRSDFGELRADFGELRADFGELRAEFNQIRAELDKLRVDVDNLGIRITALEAAHQDLRAEFTSMRAALMDRMDRLQNTLGSVKQDNAVSMANADFAHRKIDNTREELRILGEQLIALRLQLTKAETRLRDIDGQH